MLAISTLQHAAGAQPQPSMSPRPAEVALQKAPSSLPPGYGAQQGRPRAAQLMPPAEQLLPAILPLGRSPWAYLLIPRASSHQVHVSVRFPGPSLLGKPPQQSWLSSAQISPDGHARAASFD